MSIIIPFTDEDLERQDEILSCVFDPAYISTRPGPGGMYLYIY